MRYSNYEKQLMKRIYVHCLKTDTIESEMRSFIAGLDSDCRITEKGKHYRNRYECEII